MFLRRKPNLHDDGLGEVGAILDGDHAHVGASQRRVLLAQASTSRTRQNARALIATARPRPRTPRATTSYTGKGNTESVGCERAARAPQMMINHLLTPSAPALFEAEAHEPGQGTEEGGQGTEEGGRGTAEGGRGAAAPDGAAAALRGRPVRAFTAVLYYWQ